MASKKELRDGIRKKPQSETAVRIKLNPKALKPASDDTTFRCKYKK